MSIFKRVLYCGLAFWCFGCKSQDQQTVTPPNYDGPDQEGWNSRITVTSNGRTSAIVKYSHMEKYSKRRETKFNGGIVVDFYNTEGRHTSNLVAERGLLHEENNDVEAMDNVVVVSDSGMTVRTQYLRWDNVRQKIFSNDFVTITTAQNDTEALRPKSARRAALPSLARTTPTTIMEDVAVPRSQLPQLVDRIAGISARNNVRIGNFGHAGDGNLHPNYLTDARDSGAFARAERAVVEVEEAAVELGGTITGEHGVGLYKKRLLEKMMNAPAIAMMRTLNALRAAVQPDAQPHPNPHPGSGIFARPAA